MVALGDDGPAAAADGADAADAGPAYTVGQASRPCDGESVCGDLIVHRELGPGRLLLAVIDGLGHGPQARAASLAAAAALADDHRVPDLRARMQLCDRALRPTRGAAIALLDIDLGARCLRHVGVGNVATLVCSGVKRRLASTPGIVGTGLPPLRVETVALAGRGALAMFSDGLDPLFDQQQPNPLDGPEAPRELALRLVQRWGLHRDDVGLAILRWGPAP